jgi:hypothetical protein
MQLKASLPYRGDPRHPHTLLPRVSLEIQKLVAAPLRFCFVQRLVRLSFSTPPTISHTLVQGRYEVLAAPGVLCPALATSSTETSRSDDYICRAPRRVPSKLRRASTHNTVVNHSQQLGGSECSWGTEYSRRLCL